MGYMPARISIFGLRRYDVCSSFGEYIRGDIWLVGMVNTYHGGELATPPLIVLYVFDHHSILFILSDALIISYPITIGTGKPFVEPAALFINPPGIFA